MAGVFGVRVGFEDHRAKHGRQGQGHQAGQDDGRGHRDPELLVKLTDRPGHERDRDEHGRHHQGNGDDRPADLVQNLRGRAVRRKVLLGHLRVNRLDHDDRVVDDHADRQDHGEQGDQVDRQAEETEDEERADQRDGHGQGRNDGGSHVAEEHVHDERDQDERFDEGVHDLLDRRVQEVRHVVGQLVVHVGRELLPLDLLQSLLHLLDDGRCVRPGRLLEHDRRRRVAVDVRVDVEELGPEFDRGHLAEQDVLAVRVGLEDDVLVLLRPVEPADVREDVLDRLGRLAGGLTESARGADDALLGQGFHHVLGRQVVRPHPIGVQPDPHGVRPVAEVPRKAHARDPLELGHDVGVGEVEQELLVGGWGRCCKCSRT